VATPGELVSGISSRADLVEFIRELAIDLLDQPDVWENASLESYLEALAAWTQDMDGYMANAGRTTPAEPSWRVFGEMLIAARIYE
jgi:hypothetical protein